MTPTPARRVAAERGESRMIAALKPVEETDTFGSIIRECRRNIGMTQRDVAARVGIDYTYLSKLENDQLEPPSEATIERLAEVYCVQPEYLLMFTHRVPKSLKAKVRAGSLDLSRLVVLLGQRQLSDEQVSQMLRTIEFGSKRAYEPRPTHR